MAAFFIFAKNNKKIVKFILEEGGDGLKNALADKGTARKLEHALYIGITFGGSRGIRKLEKLEKKLDSGDDKAVVYYGMALFYERIDDMQGAAWCYNRVLQLRPYFESAAKKLEELEQEQNGVFV